MPLVDPVTNIDQHRLLVSRPAVNDAMAHGDEVYALRFAQPRSGGLDGGGKIGDLIRGIRPVDQRLLVDALRAKTRPRADALDLALDQPAQLLASIRREDLELEARGAGIDDEDRVHGDHAAGKTAAPRRALA
jgi:hypothetical protein